jgi:putative SOS response-associated peptidase YedK
MCGRFVSPSAKALAKDLDIQVPKSYQQSFNLAPTQLIPTLTSANHLVFYRWGLIPSWAKDPSIGNRMINARSESLSEKPSFKRALAQRRCIIPAQGFYEWKVEDKVKQPYFIFHHDKSLLLFAGLWEQWTSPEGEVIQSVTIITKEAQGNVKTLHDRMPAILSLKNKDIWLSPKLDLESAKKLLSEASLDAVEFFRVSTLVNKPANNSPQCVEPIAMAEAQRHT